MKPKIVKSKDHLAIGFKFKSFFIGGGFLSWPWVLKKKGEASIPFSARLGCFMSQRLVVSRRVQIRFMWFTVYVSMPRPIQTLFIPLGSHDLSWRGWL